MFTCKFAFCDWNHNILLSRPLRRSDNIVIKTAITFQLSNRIPSYLRQTESKRKMVMFSTRNKLNFTRTSTKKHNYCLKSTITIWEPNLLTSFRRRSHENRSQQFQNKTPIPPICRHNSTSSRTCTKRPQTYKCMFCETHINDVRATLVLLLLFHLQF